MRNVSSCLCWLFLLSEISAQAPNLRFTHLDEGLGLANNSCFTTFADSKGYIWIGTLNGLSRYEGHQFRNFRNEEDDSSSIGGNVVMDITEDKKGHLWVATLGGGLNRFDPETETFTSFVQDYSNPRSISGNDVNCIYKEEGDNMWLGTFRNGLNFFDQEKGTFQHYQLNDSLAADFESFRKNSVLNITGDHDDPNILWLAANDGLYRFNKKTARLSHYPSTREGTSGMSCHSLLSDEQGKLWAGTYGGGVVLFDTKYFSWNYYPVSPQDWKEKSSTTNIVLHIARKSTDELWVSTKNQGLLIFDTKERHFIPLENNVSDPFTLQDIGCRHVLTDKENRIWVSTLSKGISLTTPSYNLFQNHGIAIQKCSEPQIMMTDFSWNSKLKSYFITGTSCSGIYSLDENYRQKIEISVKGFPDNEQSFNTVLTDSWGNTWVGGKINLGNEGRVISRPSFLRYNAASKQLEAFSHRLMSAVPVQSYEVTDIIEDKNAKIWLATKGGGLIKLDLQNDTLIQYIQPANAQGSVNSNITINEIIEDRQGYIWLATSENSVFRFDPKQGSFLHFPVSPKGIRQQFVRSVSQDKNGMIWIGTSDRGIQLLNPTLGPEQEMKTMAISSKRIVKIVSDQSNHTWVITESGLVQYDFNKQHFVEYNEKDGIINSVTNLSQGMAFIEGKGIFVGLYNHFCQVNPDSLYFDQEPPVLKFTSFKIFEKQVFFEKSINYLDRIILDYKDNFFTINFASLNYTRPEKNLFAYKLEGFDPDWIYPSDQRHFANYTRVPAGDYVFKVKGANNNGIWNEDPIELNIIVRPPWWLSWWGYLIWFFLATVLGYGIHTYQKRKLLLDFKMKMQADEALRLREIDELKTKLYANITHEFRTPLTLILGPVTQALKHSKQLSAASLDLIQRNGRQLLRLINEILDLSKLEEGEMKTFFVRGDIITLLRCMVEPFEPYARSNQKLLTFRSSLTSLEMDYDKQKLHDILSNLLSNALKFTREGDTIEVCAGQAGGELMITVKDSGPGIAGEDLAFLFDRFQQAETGRPTTSIKGSGIGLSLTKQLVELLGGRIKVDSQFGEGSMFSVWLPIHLQATQKDEDFISANMALPVPLQAAPKIKKDIEPRPVAGKDPVRVLIVEDTPDLAQYIASCLPETYQISFAENGQIGIDRAMEEVPDIVISDVMMPEKDGFELCQTLKNEVLTSHIPIILLTALADANARVMGLRRGADAYLAKPFDEEELQVRIVKLLELRQTLRKRFSHLATNPQAGPTADEQENPDLKLEDAFILKVRDIVSKQYPDPEFDVNRFVEQAGMSETQFRRKLSALTGASPNNFIQSFRLEKARQLLKQTELNISEISFQTGFSDPSYFSRVFLRNYEVSPRDFRKTLD